MQTRDDLNIIVVTKFHYPYHNTHQFVIVLLINPDELLVHLHLGDTILLLLQRVELARSKLGHPE